jgi:hypothetical protein
MLNNLFKDKSGFLSITLAFMIFFSVLPSKASAQIKYETEYKVIKDKLPRSAITFIDSCCPSSKQKWYGEESLLAKSIEAKIKYRGSLYSIEFDTLGYIQDVEKKISFYDISQNLRSRIIMKLDSVFSKHKIDKVQVQWLGSNRVLYELIEKGNSKSPYILNYEMVLKGRRGNLTKIYEVLFSMDGSILSISEIVQRNTDNLDY